MKVGSQIISILSGIKTIMIYQYILELEEIKIKLSSENFNEYTDAIRKNKNIRQWIIILMIIIEGMLQVLKSLELFTNSFDKLVISNLMEVILKLFMMIILFYMIKIFVRLAYFFRNKKEEKMTKF